jgi:hypothetical protein
MRRWLGLGGLCLALTACRGAHSDPTQTASTAADATARPEAGANPATTAPYEVHEWGLIDVSSAGPIEIGAGPGPVQRPVRTRKPVLYVHLLDGARELAFHARVALASGSIAEHWPPGVVSGGSLDWSSVAARDERCGIDAGAGAPRELAARSASVAACDAPDHICELGELPTYVTPSAACLAVGGASGPLLFYRGVTSALALPIKASRRADMTAVVSATGPLAGAPGQVLRLSTALSGPWPQGRVVVSRAPLPANGQSVELAVGTEEVVGPGERAALTSSIMQLGLTQDEAQAFVRAWGDDLFGRDAAARDQGPPPGPRWQDVIVVALPPSCYGAISNLAFSPSPRAVRRAFLLRIDLGPVPTG